jgi:hypothetical protein
MILNESEIMRKEDTNSVFVWRVARNQGNLQEGKRVSVLTNPVPPRYEESADRDTVHRGSVKEKRLSRSGLIWLSIESNYHCDRGNGTSVSARSGNPAVKSPLLVLRSTTECGARGEEAGLVAANCMAVGSGRSVRVNADW